MVTRTNIISRNMIMIPLFLHYMNFLELAGIWSILITFICIYILLNKNVYRVIDLNTFIIFLFSITYAVFLSVNTKDISLLRLLSIVFMPTCYYIIGRYIFYRNKTFDKLLSLIYLIIFIGFIIPFISNIIHVINNGFMTARNLNVIWRPFESFTGTLIGGFFSLNMSLVPILFVGWKSKVDREYRGLSIVYILIGLFVLLNVSTRNGIYVSFISLIFSFFLFNKVFTQNSIKIVVVVLLLFTLFLLTGLLDAFKQTYMYERLILGDGDATFANNRGTLWLLSIEGIINNPMGGVKLNSIISQYAHNLWLDVAIQAGVIPLFFLTILTIRFIFNIFSIYKNITIRLLLRMLVVCISIGFLSLFFVEPIMEGMFTYFCLFCLFFGMFSSFNKNQSIAQHTPISPSSKHD